MADALLLLLLLAVRLRLAPALDNGLALTPPQGWRSWNSYTCQDSTNTTFTGGDIISDAAMRTAMKAVLDKSRTVGGVPTTLASLGYDYISMDDGWLSPAFLFLRCPHPATLPVCPPDMPCRPLCLPGPKDLSLCLCTACVLSSLVQLQGTATWTSSRALHYLRHWLANGEPDITYRHPDDLDACVPFDWRSILSGHAFS